MLATQHLRAGIAVGLACTAAGLALDAAALARVGDVLLVPAIAAVAALAPDWDQRGSTFTRAIPVAGPLGHWIIKWAHRGVYAGTRRWSDPPSRAPRRRVGRFGNRRALRLPGSGWRSAHRGITHSLVTAVAVGAAVTAACAWGPWWVTVGFLVGVLLIGDDWVTAGPLAAVYAVTGLLDLWTGDAVTTVTALRDHTVTLAPLWGAAVTAGWASHILTDACTTAGVPLWAPFSWRPRTSPLAFDTGGVAELWVARPLLVVAGLYFGYVTATHWFAPSVAIVVVGAVALYRWQK